MDVCCLLLLFYCVYFLLLPYIWRIKLNINLDQGGGGTAAWSAYSWIRQCTDDDGGADADELYLAHVVSTKAHARLLDVDPSEALAMSGVVDFVSYKDVPANNSYSPLYLPNDEETVFAVDTVGDYLTVTGC